MFLQLPAIFSASGLSRYMCKLLKYFCKALKKNFRNLNSPQYFFSQSTGRSLLERNSLAFSNILKKKNIL